MYFLHPLFVHFTIALLSVAVICDFLYLLSKKENFWQISNYLLVIGTLSAVGAVLSGNQAAQMVEMSADVEQMVNSHRNAGQLTMWSFLALSALRFLFIRFKLFEKPLKWAYYLLGLIALIFLFRTGLLGGEMVYIHGVGIQKNAQPPAEKPSFEK